MEILPLKAQNRVQIGTRNVKKIRVNKLIPATVYGLGREAMNIEVKNDEFETIIHTKAGENVIIRLEIEGDKRVEETVVIKDIQHHPVSDRVQHVDFKIISLEEKIKVNIPIHVSGESEGVKQGGILDVIHHEIEVECLPTDIPDRITIDVSKLQIEHSIHVQDVVFPSGVQPLLDGEEALVAVHAPKAPEAEEAAEEAVAGEPEVIGKEKKEGEEGEAPAAAEKKEEKKEKK